MKKFDIQIASKYSSNPTVSQGFLIQAYSDPHEQSFILIDMMGAVVLFFESAQALDEAGWKIVGGSN